MSTGQLTKVWDSAPFGLKGLPEVAGRLAQQLEWGEVIALQAPMGTGKTTLVAAVARHHGAEDAASSPTFALCQSYPLASDGATSRLIRHLDLYRIRHEDELQDLGWEELMHDAEALTFVEWPERAADHFPDHTRLLRMECLPDGMRMATLWQRESA